MSICIILNHSFIIKVQAMCMLAYAERIDITVENS